MDSFHRILGCKIFIIELSIYNYSDALPIPKLILTVFFYKKYKLIVLYSYIQLLFTIFDKFNYNISQNLLSQIKSKANMDHTVDLTCLINTSF